MTKFDREFSTKDVSVNVIVAASKTATRKTVI